MCMDDLSQRGREYDDNVDIMWARVRSLRSASIITAKRENTNPLETCCLSGINPSVSH